MNSDEMAVKQTDRHSELDVTFNKDLNWSPQSKPQIK